MKTAKEIINQYLTEPQTINEVYEELLEHIKVNDTDIEACNYFELLGVIKTYQNKRFFASLREGR